MFMKKSFFWVMMCVVVMLCAAVVSARPLNPINDSGLIAYFPLDINYNSTVGDKFLTPFADVVTATDCLYGNCSGVTNISTENYIAYYYTGTTGYPVLGSLSFWYRSNTSDPTTACGGNCFVKQIYNDVDSRSWYISSLNRLLFTDSEAGDATLVGNATVINDETRWYFIVSTWSNVTGTKFYVNGVLYANSTQLKSPSVSDGSLDSFLVGVGSGAGGQGYIDDVGVFNVTLSDAQILNIYNDTSIELPAAENQTNQVKLVNVSWRPSSAYVGDNISCWATAWTTNVSLLNLSYNVLVNGSSGAVGSVAATNNTATLLFSIDTISGYGEGANITCEVQAVTVGNTSASVQSSIILTAPAPSPVYQVGLSVPVWFPAVAYDGDNISCNATAWSTDPAYLDIDFEILVNGSTLTSGVTSAVNNSNAYVFLGSTVGFGGGANVTCLVQAFTTGNSSELKQSSLILLHTSVPIPPTPTPTGLVTLSCPSGSTLGVCALLREGGGAVAVFVSAITSPVATIMLVVALCALLAGVLGYLGSGLIKRVGGEKR